MDDLLIWTMNTPWGEFSIGVFDGWLLWCFVVSVAAAVGGGGVRQVNQVIGKDNDK